MAEYSENDFLTLLEVAQIDKRLTQLEFQRSHMAEAVALNDANANARDLHVKAVELASELVELQEQVTKAEIDVEQVESRMAKDRSLLDSGSITDSKQLIELQHELENLSKRLVELEEIEFEALSQVEDFKRTLKEVEQETVNAEQVLHDAKDRLERAVASLDAELKELQNQRDLCLSNLDEALKSVYLKIKNDRGIGAAKLLGSKCDSCHLELRGAEFSDIKKLPVTALVRCPECTAILIRVERD